MCMEKPKKFQKCQDTVEQEKLSSQKSTTNPRSLFKICVNYIAQNLHMVETFCDFPDLVGIKIFDKAVELKKFNILDNVNGTDSLRNIRLFCDAYNDSVLSSLNVSNCHLGINFCQQHLCSFSDLCALDVSNCGLGDDHDLLSHIAHLKCLKELSVRRNSLSDKGIHRMCAPHGMFRRGPGHLSILDISENGGISSKSISKLSCFKDLRKVDITATGVKRKDVSRDWNMHPIKAERCIEVHNVGWASEIVEMWMAAAENTMEKKIPDTKTDIKKFYSRSKERRKECYHEDSRTMQFVPGFRMILERHLPSKDTSASSKQNKCLSKNEPKHAVTSEDTEFLMNCYLKT